jgi:WD40 repeat protein
LRGEQEPLEPQARFDHAPKELERIIRKSLRRNREERYASAGEMLDDLSALKRRLDNRASRRMVKLSALAILLAALFVALAAWLSVNETWAERVIRDGHTAAARCSAFSPDGRLLVSGDEDGWVMVWDFARRERLAAFKAHTAWVNSIAFSPDGKWLVTGGDDRNVIVWDVARLEQVTILHDHQRPVVSVVFSPDGRLLAAASAATARGQRGGTILWEVALWRKTHELPLAFSRGRLSFSPDGRRLITSKRLQAWEVERGREATNYLDPSWGGDETAISAETGRLVSISPWGAVTFVDLARRRLIGRRSIDHYKGDAIAISPDGRFVASGSGDIFLWDFETQTKLARLEHKAMVKSLTFSPDGRWLVSTHEDGAVLQWNVAERDRVANFNEHSGSVLAVAWAPDGKRFASAGADRSVIIWNTATGRKEATLSGHTSRVTAVAFSFDGRWVASTGHDGEVIFWDTERRQARLRLNHPGQEQASHCVALSPDGRWVATTNGVYESTGGRQVTDFRTTPFLQRVFFSALAFSPDGQRLACVAQNYVDILLLDADRWRLLYRLDSLPLQFTSVSFSPDGKRLVTGEDEHGVRLWQVDPLREEALLGRHAARVKSVAFSPDGRQVVSAGDDKMIALWDVGSRKLITKIGLHTAPVYAVAFSPDGKQLVSGGHDHSVRLYTRHRALWGFRLGD